MKIEKLPNGGERRIYDPDDLIIQSIRSNAGYSTYTLNDQLHREDGPAIQYSNGLGFWYLHGKRYHPKDNDEWLRWMKLKSLL